MTSDRRTRFLNLPTTWLGKVALSFAGPFLAYWALRVVLSATDLTDGERFTEGYWLAIAEALALGTGIAAGATALLAVVRQGERSLLVFGIAALGLMGTALIIGELVGPR
jgi:hypothetical protein